MSKEISNKKAHFCIRFDTIIPGAKRGYYGFIIVVIPCIPGAKWGYYGFIIVVVRALVRRDFLLATYSPHFFPDFFQIWRVA